MAKPVVRLGYTGREYVLLSCPKRETTHVIFMSMEEVFTELPLTVYDFKITLIPKIEVFDLW